MKIERIKIKDKEVEFDKKDQVVCVINNMPYDEIKDFIIFDNERKGDFDSDLGCFLQKDHFFGVKLDDNKKTIMLSIAESYFKEISPIELSGGKKIYFIYDPDDVFVDFDIKLFNKDSVIFEDYKNPNKMASYFSRFFYGIHKKMNLLSKNTLKSVFFSLSKKISSEIYPGAGGS